MAKRAIKAGERAPGAELPAPATASCPATGNVVVLAEDAALLDLLRDTLEGRHRIWRADSTMHAADLIVASRDSILFVDAAVMTHETPALVEKLYAQFPNLPVIVTGRRDDETELGPLIASGAVYRFLHKPVSAERIRTFMDAAERRLSEQPVGATPREPSASLDVPARSMPRLKVSPAFIRKLLWAGASLVILALLVAGAAELIRKRPWEEIRLPALSELLQQASSPPAAGPAATAGQEDPVPTTARPASEVARLLNLAGIALSQGHLAEPEGQNAVELYRLVLLRDPGNTQAREGLSRATDRLLLAVEQALLAGDLAAAASALDSARSADPDNPRLEFLSAQLTRERDLAVAVEQRAASGIDRAQRAVGAEIRRLLKLADARMRSGRLVGDADSAEAYVAAARRSRPDDPGVRQALNALSGRMLLAASQAMVDGDNPAALAWIERADGLGVDPQAVARLRAEVESQRLASVREDHSRLLALANQRIAQGRLLEPRADSARHFIELLRAASPGYPGLADTEALLAQGLLDQAQQLSGEGRLDEARRVLEEAQAAGASPQALASLRGGLESGRGGSPGAVIPESELTRLVSRPAKYPARAVARGIEGWVEIEYTVTREGWTRDLRITDSSPEGYFEETVLDAVSSWRYEPRRIGGRAVDQRVRARLRFELAEP